MKTVLTGVALAALLALGGCKTGYVWTSGVPAEMRTVAVPTFRNESKVTELGSIAARQVLREFQREGTFRVVRPDDAAIEIQGVIKKASRVDGLADRRGGFRHSEYYFNAVAIVSVIDHRSGKVLVDNRRYEATATFVAGQDGQTAMRDASGRLAEDLAQKIVDDVLGMKW